MAAGEVTVRIDRAATVVFAVLSDVEQTPRWSTSAIDARRTSAGPVGVGSTAHEVSRFLGRRLEVDSRIVALEPDRLLGVLTTGGPFPFRVTFRVDPAGRGCQVRAAFEARPGGVLRLLEGPLGMVVRRKLARDLANLKRVLERYAPTR